MLNAPSFLTEDKARAERHAHLTEGISNPLVKNVVETLLDNQQYRAVHESTDSSAVALFTRIAKPLIRRIYPALVANDLVSIQPMTLPTGKVFYLDFKLSDTMGALTAGTRTDSETGGLYAVGYSNKPQYYTSGIVRNDATPGTGDGTKTVFSLAKQGIKAGSVVVRVNGTVQTAGITVDLKAGTLTFSAAPANGATIVADYQLQFEGNSNAPEVELTMQSSSVDAEQKRIRARWTLEAQQDLQAYHGIDAEAELTKHMADEVKREIDRTIIDDLVSAGSSTVTTWNYTWPGASAGYPAQRDYLETLVHAINDAALNIYKKRFVQANFIVCGTDVLSRLDKLQSFRVLNGGANVPSGGVAGGSVSLGSGPNVLGTLESRYKVIVDPLFQANTILVGYKGEDWQKTGYVFAPYVAFESQTFIDPNDLVPRKGLMTRFGRHLVNKDFYATVSIAP
jgi:hypothetical protein